MGKIEHNIHYINISLDVSKLQYVERRDGNATYGEIKAYVLEHYGLNVSSRYIGQIKGKVGIRERKNYNVGSGKSRVPTCPIEKENAIVEAFKFFGMME